MAKRTTFACGMLLALALPALASAQATRQDMPVVALPEVPSGVVRLSAHADLGSIMQDTKNGTSDFALPQTFLIDLQTGERAVLADVPPELAGFMQAHPMPTIKGKAPPDRNLAELLHSTLHEDGRPFALADLGENKRFALFQLWAGWCAPCMQEAKELGEMFKKRPMPELAWVTVEADPMKPYKKTTTSQRASDVAAGIQEH